jgi:hypothetical protein
VKHVSAPGDSICRKEIIPGWRTHVCLCATSSRCRPAPEMQRGQGALGVQMLAASDKLGTAGKNQLYISVNDHTVAHSNVSSIFMFLSYSRIYSI